MLSGQIGCKIAASEETASPLNPSQMSSSTEDSDGLGTFA